MCNPTSVFWETLAAGEVWESAIVPSPEEPGTYRVGVHVGYGCDTTVSWAEATCDLERVEYSLLFEVTD